MATYDMTSKDTTGVSSNSLAVLPSQTGMGVMRMVQAYLDIDALVAAGYSGADGDIFQLLEIPAGCLVLFAGADITSTGYCAEGSNGQSNDVTTGAASLFTQFQSATDTIDCKIAGAAPATGRLRAYACIIDCNDLGASGKAADVDRDQLA